MHSVGWILLRITIGDRVCQFPSSWECLFRPQLSALRKEFDPQAHNQHTTCFVSLLIITQTPITKHIHVLNSKLHTIILFLQITNSTQLLQIAKLTLPNSHHQHITAKLFRICNTFMFAIHSYNICTTYSCKKWQ